MQRSSVARRRAPRPAKLPRPIAPVAHERLYARALLGIVSEIRESIDRNLLPAFDAAAASFAMERGDSARADAWPGFITTAISSIGFDMTRAIARGQRLVVETGEGVSNWARSQFQRYAAKAVGVNLLRSEPWLDGLLESWATTNSRLITSIGTRYLDDVAARAQDMVRQGKSHAAFAKELRERYQLTQARAKLIARTEVAKLNGQITKARQTGLGIKTYTWRTSADERVRKSHTALEGMECRWDDDTVFRRKGETEWRKRSSIGAFIGDPGQDYQCFPGWLKPDYVPDVKKLYRHRYEGELASLVTLGGLSLRATRNHPILTPEGLKPIHLLREGDYVIRACHEGRDRSHLDGERFIPSFEQIHAALAVLLGPAPREEGDRRQFHGDGSDGEIEVVTIDGLLTRKGYASGVEKIREFCLAEADMVIGWAALTGCREGADMLPGLGLSPDGIMSRLDLVLPRIIAHLSPLELFSLALGSRRGASIDQAAPDHLTGNPEVLGDSVFAFSALVHGPDFIRRHFELACRGRAEVPHHSANIEMLGKGLATDPDQSRHSGQASTLPVKLDRIVYRGGVDFSGHVYNLETGSGFYYADSVAVGNCRCTAAANIAQTLDDLLGPDPAARKAIA